MLPVIIEQDGDIIEAEANYFPLLPSDKRYSKKLKKELFDFVGFVIYKEKMLAVFPKHYFEEKNVLNEQETKENVKLLFQVIRKYIFENKSNPVADKYIGYEENFESDYPFSDFFRVYEYYKKYGIYKEENILVKKNSKGKISWKDTIQKSNVIVSNDNLIFLPLYSKNISTKDAFISQCMVYVINHTLKNFPYFIELPLVRGTECKIDFLTNKDYTLRQLYQYRNTIFKDYQKELLEALISFFEKYNKKADGGAIHIKINYFDMIWEKMVNKYLNDCFVRVDEQNRKLEFKYERNKKSNNFKSKKFDIDKSEHKFSIKPDHYLNDGENMYVFDSKYYNEINDLNYKQFSYTILLGNSQLGKNRKLYSALLLPGKSKGKLHLQLDIPYCQLNQGCNYIIEQFLDVKLLMKNYLNMNIENELKEQKI